MLQYPIKAMKVGEVLDVAIKLTRDNFKALFLITLLTSFIPGALGCVFNHYGRMDESSLNRLFDDPKLIRAQVLTPDESEMRFLSQTFNWIQVLVIGPFTCGVLLLYISGVYLGEPISIGEALQWAKRRLFRLGLAEFGYLFGMVVGLILLVVPGIYFAAMYLLVEQTVVYEDLGVIAAFRRSSALTKDQLSHAFVLLFLIFAFSVPISMAITTLPVWQLRVILLALNMCLTHVAGATITAVFYFSCRCKKENFDLQILARESAAEVTAPTAPAVS